MSFSICQKACSAVYMQNISKSTQQSSESCYYLCLTDGDLSLREIIELIQNYLLILPGSEIGLSDSKAHAIDNLPYPRIQMLYLLLILLCFLLLWCAHMNLYVSGLDPLQLLMHVPSNSNLSHFKIIYCQRKGGEERWERAKRG